MLRMNHERTAFETLGINNETVVVPIATVKVIVDNTVAGQILEYPFDRPNIVPAVKILRGVCPGLPLKYAKDIVDIYIALRLS
jgi:hypothetical protein